MMKPAVTLRPLLLLLTCLLLTCGCGKKGPVRPLRQPLPAAPVELTAHQQGNLMQIAWEIPAINQDGTVLDNLQGFNIYKMSYDLADNCPECRDTSVLLRQVDLDFLKNAERLGNRMTIWDNNLDAEFGYQYRVAAYTRNNREGEPAVIRHPFLTPLPAPTGLEALGHDRMVRLSWQPPMLNSRVRVLGYNVYRRASGESRSPFPSNNQVIKETTFEDYGLTNGVTYVYSVRVVAEIEDIRLESAAAVSVEAIPAPEK